MILPRTNLGLRVEHGKEAWVLDNADAPSIADAVLAIRNDPALAATLARGAAEYHGRTSRRLHSLGRGMRDFYDQLLRTCEDCRVVRDGSVIAYDCAWQYPAVTERHAYVRAHEALPRSEGGVYFAFPWATLFDRLKANQDTGRSLLDIALGFRRELSRYERVVTVCQHILMPDFQELFHALGVTHVFWSHAVKGQERFPEYPDIAIHPFPLYPVRCPGTLVRERRSLLFFFMGARDNEWYLTNSRSLIIDNLGKDPRGAIVARKGWHFHKVVYDCQVRRPGRDIRDAEDRKAAEDYCRMLADSVFSLCPSGSGPNSIRLWESMAFGAIPVVLSDTYRAPAPAELWDQAVVTCPETLEDILALPDRLEALSRDTEAMRRKRQALHELWLRYGPDNFVQDIAELLKKG